ncbi:MAG: hypothetical protein LBS59_00625 [Puniceicoccales bacterium]|jgi:hypothetical protein|nr:hypothetical protein [Puniceicoccales bacterium]
MKKILYIFPFFFFLSCADESSVRCDKLGEPQSFIMVPPSSLCPENKLVSVYRNYYRNYSQKSFYIESLYLNYDNTEYDITSIAELRKRLKERGINSIVLVYVKIEDERYNGLNYEKDVRPLRDKFNSYGIQISGILHSGSSIVDYYSLQ